MLINVIAFVAHFIPGKKHLAFPLLCIGKACHYINIALDKPVVNLRPAAADIFIFSAAVIRNLLEILIAVAALFLGWRHALLKTADLIIANTDRPQRRLLRARVGRIKRRYEKRCAQQKRDEPISFENRFFHTELFPLLFRADRRPYALRFVHLFG